jgi:hypothetical protein
VVKGVKNSTRYRIIEICELLCGSVLPIVFWLSLIFGFDAPYVAILTVICAVAHELGHIGTIYAFTGDESRIRGHSSGFRISRSSPLSYRKEIAILLAGPLVNIVTAIVLWQFGDLLFGYIRIFAVLNLATGLSNLMPIEGYDGYGAICEIFRAVGHPQMIKKLEAFSFVLSVSVTFIALYLIERFGEGYWIFGLFFFGTVSKLVSFGKYDIFGE